MFISRSLLPALLLALTTTSARADDPRANDELGLDAAGIIRLRGFIAKNYYFTTTDGYVINLVRALNPLINNGTSGLATKDVLLFIHGIFTNAKCFIMNSVGAKPEDLSSDDVRSMSQEELNEKYGNSTNSKSLVFAALVRGYEVWMMNRRGTIYSQGYVGNNQPRSNYTSQTGGRRKREISLTGLLLNNTIADAIKNNPLTGAIDEFSQLLSSPKNLLNQLNPIYWNYTFDTEGAIDFPEAIKFVLNVTERATLSVVGHSAGGAIPLLGLFQKPETANLLRKAILWAPGVDQGATPPEERSPLRQISVYFKRPLEFYTGPVAPSLLNPILQSLVATLCETSLVADTFCQAGDSFIFGYGGDQQEILPGFLTAAPDTIASHELAQLIQGVSDLRTHFYNYESRERNSIAYGMEEPPEYDFSQILFNGLSIWYGLTDAFVQFKDVQQLISDLKVPVKTRFFNDTGLYWNHISFLIHKQIATYLILPCVKELES